MMIRFSFIYLLYFVIYLTIVYSYDDNNIDVENENRPDKPNEEFKKLNRIKRQGYYNTPSNASSVYIITSFTSLTTTTHTTPFVNQTNSPLTSTITMTTRPSTISNTMSLYNPDSCYNSSFIRLMNGTCVKKYDGQIIATGILYNSSAGPSETADALSLYISSITNASPTPNNTNTLTINELESVVDNLGNLNLTINSNTSFVTIQQPYQANNLTVLGASFIRGIGGEIIYTSNRDNITQEYLSVAAIISEESLIGVLSLNLLIIDIPTPYKYADNITRKTVASSVIIATLRRNSSTYNNPELISLYFSPFGEHRQYSNGEYLCSFYDTNNSCWSEYGCSDAYFNKQFNRYECNCTHFTSFALVWLPESLSTTNFTQSFDAQDIASLIFQLISIICFLIIILHAICIRILDPMGRVQTLKLLPLLSTASTTILFIFFIALSLTVYTQTSSSDETDCFLTSKILMFITYFLLIYMFAVKTTVGYFYYLRFVRLFPQPSHRQLLLMLMISFFISLLSVAFAVGFNTNPTYNITQLYPYEFCWFTRNVVYYFLTIPIGVFLLLNIITIFLVSRSIITHALNATRPELVNRRMKRCVVVLLSSCVTQGIGWLIGPFITFASQIPGDILGWFFIIFNGLEGFWTIILYVMIRQQRLDEQKHISAAMKLSKSVGILPIKEKKMDNKDEHKGIDERTPEKYIRKDRLYSFNDLHKRDTDISNDYDDRVFN